MGGEEKNKKIPLTQITITILCNLVSNEFKKIHDNLNTEEEDVLLLKNKFEKSLKTSQATIEEGIKRQLIILNQRKIRSIESDTLFIKGNHDSQIKNELDAENIIYNVLKTGTKEKKSIKIMKVLRMESKSKTPNPVYKIVLPPSSYRVETAKSTEKNFETRNLTQILFNSLKEKRHKFAEFNITRMIPSYCKNHYKKLNDWAFELKQELYTKDKSIIRCKIAYDYNKHHLILKYKFKGSQTWNELNYTDSPSAHKKIPKKIISKFNEIYETIDYIIEADNKLSPKGSETYNFVSSNQESDKESTNSKEEYSKKSLQSETDEETHLNPTYSLRKRKSNNKKYKTKR